MILQWEVPAPISACSNGECSINPRVMSELTYDSHITLRKHWDRGSSLLCMSIGHTR